MNGKGTQVQRELQREVKEAQKKIDAREFDEAKEQLQGLRTRCAQLGIHTAQVAWMLAVIGDYTGDADMAVQFIQEAVRADPLSQPVLRSFDIIAQRLKGTLTDADRAADAEDTPHLYGLLQQLGEADVPCHLVMARFEARTGKHAEALERVKSVLLLSPYVQEAWLLEAEVAGLLGDTELQRAAQVEAAALTGDARPVPFGMPGVAQG
jgi:tetratricopeptide (TPR) repeat protein